MNTPESPENMANHWWWRPGWRVGRRFYTWHLTFDDQPNVQQLIGTYRDALVGIPGLDLIPDQWLHLTMQGIGFVGEVDEKDVTAIVDAARTRLAAVPESRSASIRRPSPQRPSRHLPNPPSV